MAIQTVLFDFDGTLANTNALISHSHLHVLEEYYPGVYDLDRVRAFNGPSLDMVYSGLNPDEKDSMIAKYRAFNEAHHDEMVHLFTGVKESLAELKANGICLAVVSTKYNEILIQGLTILDIKDYFDVIVGGLDYTHAKPDPEPIFVALAKLNREKETAIMVGDNSHDIESAKNAGIPSVFVAWSEKTLEEIAPYQPDFIVNSMADLTKLVLESNMK
ncbi:pyrophosphatase PpaX [Carnobacterium gallinarum]|uniref:pyrophosphatase PpaX n=1 Tax=Carnobacterium gallinarum TaxID=2749 RepID=UPI00055652B9|nr:pyrophosphatase PpaX [Carnobacterium gallinarum]